nr:MAG TPA: hypothetical protein [Caudoviricetes sp.]
MKGSIKQIEWAGELKEQAMTVLEWARDNFPADYKDGDEQIWKENLTGLMMCLDRVESASYIIDAFKDGAPYACTMKDMGRIASIIKIWIINDRYHIITVPTQDEIRAELAAAEQPAPVEETAEEAAPETKEETIKAEAAAPEAVILNDLVIDRHTLLPHLLLRDLGGDPDSIIDRWQQRYNDDPNPMDAETYDAQRHDIHKQMSRLFGEAPDPGICAAEAADCAYYEIIKEIKRLYFGRLDRAAAVMIYDAIGDFGELRLVDNCDDLTFNDFAFRCAWEAAHTDEKHLPTWHGKED